MSSLADIDIVTSDRPAPRSGGIMQCPADGGHPALFELICYDCGDDPGQAYGEIPPRLQRLRGPRPIAIAWAAYERHLGLGLTGRG
jgi:hypothetical protein